MINHFFWPQCSKICYAIWIAQVNTLLQRDSTWGKPVPCCPRESKVSVIIMANKETLPPWKTTYSQAYSTVSNCSFCSENVPALQACILPQTLTLSEVHRNKTQENWDSQSESDFIQSIISINMHMCPYKLRILHKLTAHYQHHRAHFTA